MILTLTTTTIPATDLGYLLHKNPARCQSFDLTFGKAHVFYPEATRERCTAVLLLDVDPVGLSRRPRGERATPLEPYVNDRPYVASSFLCVAIAEVLGTALAGRCRDKPELVDKRIPLEVELCAIDARGGEWLLPKLFEPLGYQVETTPHPAFVDGQESRGRLVTLRLRAELTVSEVLSHLYVLIPVLDDEKHYWVGDDEVEKLLRHGKGWLSTHPEKELIALRYLKHQRSLARDAMSRLETPVENEPEASVEAQEKEEQGLEQRIGLNEQRLSAVRDAVIAAGARSVVDLGCGEGKLLSLLLAERTLDRIVGVDVSLRALEIAAERLHLADMPEKRRERIELLQGSLVYRDSRLSGFDVAAVVEVIEHLDVSRLGDFARVLFAHVRPHTIILTTPNAEYNVRFPGLPAGRFRHRDHRFEWTRAQLAEWAQSTSHRFGYEVAISPIGEIDADVGAPTQMAIFRRVEVAS